ncbi:MAG: DUF1743 domain-containing protein [Candidatus Nanohalobium sp.]
MSAAMVSQGSWEREDEQEEESLEKVRRNRYGDIVLSVDSSKIYVQDVEGEKAPIKFGLQDNQKLRKSIEKLSEGQTLNEAKSHYYSTNNQPVVNRTTEFLDYPGDSGRLPEEYREGFSRLAEILDEGTEFIISEIDDDIEEFQQRGYSREEFCGVMSERYGVSEITVGRYISEHLNGWED